MTAQGRSLSPRQEEILRLLTQGRSNKEIAAALGLTDGTVKQHLHLLFRKLGVHNRAMAAVLGAALKTGTPPEPSAPRSAVPDASQFARRLVTTVAADPRRRGDESPHSLQHWSRSVWALQDRGMRLCRWFDGSFEALPGGAFVVWFGLRQGHGDDAARATAYCRALIRAAADLPALELGLGMATSREVVSELPSPQPQLASSAFRLALKLAEQAESGGIRACVATARMADADAPTAPHDAMKSPPDDDTSVAVAVEPAPDQDAAGRWGGLPFLPDLCQATRNGRAQWLAVESWPPQDGSRLAHALGEAMSTQGFQVHHLWLPAPAASPAAMRESLSGQLQLRHPDSQRAGPTHARRLLDDLELALRSGPTALILHGLDGLARVQSLFDDAALDRIAGWPLIVVGSSLRRLGQAQTSLRLLGHNPAHVPFSRVLRLEVPRALQADPALRPDTQAVLDRVSAFARAVARERSRRPRGSVQAIAASLQAPVGEVAAACKELAREGLVVLHGQDIEFRDAETAGAVLATLLRSGND